MERKVIRVHPILDYAEFIIGPAEGRTRWLHPGYQLPDRDGHCCTAADLLLARAVRSGAPSIPQRTSTMLP